MEQKGIKSMCKKECKNVEPDVKLLRNFMNSSSLEEFLKTTYGDPLMRLAVHKVVEVDRKTIVIWNDGTSTQVTREKNTVADPYNAIMAAFLKKIFGAKAFHKKMERAMTKREIQCVTATNTRDKSGRFTSTKKKVDTGSKSTSKKK